MCFGHPSRGVWSPRHSWLPYQGHIGAVPVCGDCAAMIWAPCELERVAVQSSPLRWCDGEVTRSGWHFSVGALNHLACRTDRTPPQFAAALPHIEGQRHLRRQPGHGKSHGTFCACDASDRDVGAGLRPIAFAIKCRHLSPFARRIPVRSVCTLCARVCGGGALYCAAPSSHSIIVHTDGALKINLPLPSHPCPWLGTRRCYCGQCTAKADTALPQHYLLMLHYLLILQYRSTTNILPSTHHSQRTIQCGIRRTPSSSPVALWGTACSLTPIALLIPQPARPNA